MLAGGIRPHLYCLPILKRDHHQQALIRVATSGNPRFFLGTDSAPHSLLAKETACGCAGIYSAGSAIEYYAAVFETEDKLEKLEGFASHFGTDFYHLPRNRDKIKLLKQRWTIPQTLPMGDEQLVPMGAGESIEWCLQE